MIQSMRQEIKELVREVFEEIMRDYNEELLAMSDSWNAPLPMVTDMFAKILGEALVNYSDQ